MHIDKQLKYKTFMYRKVKYKTHLSLKQMIEKSWLLPFSHTYIHLFHTIRRRRMIIIIFVMSLCLSVVMYFLYYLYLNVYIEVVLEEICSFFFK